MPRKYPQEQASSRHRRQKISELKIPLYVKVIGLVVLGLLVFGVPLGLWIQGRYDTDEEIATNKPKSHEVIRVVSTFKAPKEEDAIRMVKQALAARTVPELKKSIRMGESSAKEIFEFLGGLDEKEGKADQFDWLAGMDANGLQIEGILVKLGEKHTRIAMLTPDENGVWLMDFDSFARKTHPDWKQILSSNGSEALVRVYTGRDAYYNGEFSDEQAWKCYAMASPDTDTLLMGYVKPGSSQHIALESILAGKAINRAVVKIRHEANMDARQFIIQEVTAEDWVVGNSPYDRRFTPNTQMLSIPGPSGGSSQTADPGS